MEAERVAEAVAGASITRLTPQAMYRQIRALAWQGNLLYASRGYRLFCRQVASGAESDWQFIGRWTPPWWRNLTSASRLSFRLVRDGFHALAVLASGELVAAVPGAIVTLKPGETEFRVTHRVTRGTRPLHIVATPQGALYWGEYFDNAARDEVHLYGSRDGGISWRVFYTFPKGAIRHVHNIVYDRWGDCLWVLTGDNGDECRVLRASCDFRSVEVVLSGNQQARAVAMVPAAEGLYFATDTPLEANFVYRMDRGGKLNRLAPISSSSIYGCEAGGTIFFSTMVEPSEVNRDSSVRLCAVTRDGCQPLLAWKKDVWPMRFFQYGNAWLPDGENTSRHLAVTAVAVEGSDLTTTLYQVD